jgi:hypothetical protein
MTPVVDGVSRHLADKVIPIAIIGLIATSALWWPIVTGDAARAGAANPQIYRAFLTIYDACLREQWPMETVRCKGAMSILQPAVLASVDSCAHGRYVCDIRDEYCTLVRLGFPLPAYFRPDSEFANEVPC